MPRNNFDDLFSKKVTKQTPGAFSGIASVVDSVVTKTKRRYGTIPLNRVRPNPFQPRKTFDREKLEELGLSIKEHGLLEPLVVRESQDNYFDLACGERRWRAMQLMDISEAEAIILDKNCSDEEMEQVALIENIQREDLKPIELALAYDRLRKSSNGVSRSLSEIAAIVHQPKSTIDDHLAILRAPDDVRQLIMDDPTVPLRVIRDLSNVENTDDRAYLIAEVRSGSLTSNAITRILQQLKKAQREKVTDQPISSPNQENELAASSPNKPSLQGTGPIEEDTKKSSTRRPVSPTLALAALEQKLLRDGKQFQKIVQRLQEESKHMTPEEKRLVTASVSQWALWIQQTLHLVKEES